MTMIDDVQTLRMRTWNSMREIIDSAEARGGVGAILSGEEEQTYQRLNAELDGLDARLTDLRAKQQREADSNDAMRRLGIPTQSGRSGSENDRELDRAFRHAALNNDSRPIIVNGSNDRSGYSPGLERRALTTASGSGALGTSMFASILGVMVDNSSILAAGATVLNSDTGEPIKVPKSSALSTAAIVTEGSAIGVSDPTLGFVSLGAFKYGFLTSVTNELVADNFFDLISYLAIQAGTALANGFGAHAITGTGTGQPRGVVTDATLGVTGGTGVAGVPSADNLIDLAHSLVPAYAANASWVMRNSTLGAIRKLKDGGTGRYIVDITAPMAHNGVGMLLGMPVFVDPTVAATGLNAKSVLCGDFSRYWVRMVQGIRFERSVDYAFNTDVTTYRALARMDGSLIDTSGAVKYFVGGAS